MLYVLHVQMETEDECENHCELPAVYADREKALARAKSEAQGIAERLEEEEDSESEIDVVDADVGGELIGYRVIDISVDYWHASVEVLAIADVDLTEPVPSDPGCEICGGPSH